MPHDNLVRRDRQPSLPLDRSPCFRGKGWLGYVCFALSTTRCSAFRRLARRNHDPRGVLDLRLLRERTE